MKEKVEIATDRAASGDALLFRSQKDGSILLAAQRAARRQPLFAQRPTKWVRLPPKGRRDGETFSQKKAKNTEILSKTRRGEKNLGPKILGGESRGGGAPSPPPSSNTNAALGITRVLLQRMGGLDDLTRI